MNEEDVTYEIWECRLSTDTVTRRHRRDRGHTLPIAQTIADEYNADEAELAGIEHRKVRTRYFVVKAKTVFEAVLS